MSFHQVKYLDSYRGDFSLKNTRKQRGNFMAVHGHWSREAAQTHPWVVNSVWESCFVKTFDTHKKDLGFSSQQQKHSSKIQTPGRFFVFLLGKKHGLHFLSFWTSQQKYGKLLKVSGFSRGAFRISSALLEEFCKRWGKCIICCALSILTPQITGCFEDPIPAIQVQTLDPLGDQEHGRFKVWTTCVILWGVSSMSISLPGNSAGALFWDG